MKKMKENTNLFTHIVLTFRDYTFDVFFLEIRFICSQTWFHSFNPFLYNSFKLPLWNATKDYLGFLDHLGICFEDPAKRFTFQE